MALEIVGPDVGDRIGHLSLKNECDVSVTLDEIPGETLVVDMFRGHW